MSDDARTDMPDEFDPYLHEALARPEFARTYVAEQHAEVDRLRAELDRHGVAGDELDQLWTDAEIHGLTPGIEEQMRAASDRWRSVRGATLTDVPAADPQPVNADLTSRLRAYPGDGAHQAAAPTDARTELRVPSDFRSVVPPNSDILPSPSPAAAPTDGQAPAEVRMRETLDRFARGEISVDDAVTATVVQGTPAADGQAPADEQPPSRDVVEVPRGRLTEWYGLLRKAVDATVSPLAGDLSAASGEVAYWGQQPAAPADDTAAPGGPTADEAVASAARIVEAWAHLRMDTPEDQATHDELVRVSRATIAAYVRTRPWSSAGQPVRDSQPEATAAPDRRLAWTIYDERGGVGSIVTDLDTEQWSAGSADTEVEARAIARRRLDESPSGGTRPDDGDLVEHARAFVLRSQAVPAYIALGVLDEVTALRLAARPVRDGGEPT